MRYILAISGLLVAVLAALALWFLLPRGDAGPVQAATVTIAQAQPAAPVGTTSAENGEGSLRVCNETSNQVSISLGYKAPRGWQSEGWWVAGPTECKTVFNGRLDARYYYIFAADDVGGGVWDGTHYMCTRDETFTIFGVEDCLARGYERTGFFEVDTQSKTNWTLQLTDGEVVSSGVDAGEEALPLEGDMPDGGADDPPADSEQAPSDEGTDTQ